MDITRDILYRDFLLNDEDVEANVTPGDFAGTGITGCTVETVDFSDVDIVQFMEKRSQADGMDAGQPFQGARRIHMTGTLYGLTRALLYDAYLDLRRALNPVLAFLDEPADKGFQPLYFSVPTNDIVNWPLGAIDLRVLAMPRGLEANFQKDMVGGDDDDQLALPWQATFVCKDPAIMHDTPIDVEFTSSVGATEWGHRGNFPAPINLLAVVGTGAGSLQIATGGVTLTITIPAGTDNREIRYRDKLLTISESGGVNELPAMGKMSLSGTTHPTVAPGTENNTYTITLTSATLKTGTHMWFYEQWA